MNSTKLCSPYETKIQFQCSILIQIHFSLLHSNRDEKNKTKIICKKGLRPKLGCGLFSFHLASSMLLAQRSSVCSLCSIMGGDCMTVPNIPSIPCPVVSGQSSLGPGVSPDHVVWPGTTLGPQLQVVTWLETKVMCDLHAQN